MVLLTLYAIQEISQHLEALLAVEVIGIDHCKRLTDHILTHQHSVVGAPGFGALMVVLAAGRNLIQALETYFAGYLVSILGNNYTAKILLKILADNEYYLAEACAQSIEYRVVHDGFTIGAQAVQLLQASVAATHTGSQNKQCWFHII